MIESSYVFLLEECLQFMRENEETESTRFHGFKDYEIARLDRDIAWMRSTPENVDTIRADFYRFFSEHDTRRNTDFLSVFPEMREWWELCRYNANR